MQQASWGALVFSASSSKIRTLSDLSTSIKAKKKADNSSGTATVTGHELQTLSLSYTTTHEAGIDPRKEYEELAAQVGDVHPFLLGSVPFGASLYQLTAVNLNNFSLDNFGNFRTGDLSLELQEYDDGTGTDALKIIYKGVDIYSKISVKKCIYEMNAEGKADTLELVFNDTGRQWDSWKAEQDEVIEVSSADKTGTDGQITTGKLWIYAVTPENGAYTLKASSIPATSKNRTSKSWDNVTLEMLAKEVADRHSLKLKTYDLPQVTYKYVCQDNEPDFIFLSRIAKLEGCSFLVFNETLIVYAEKAREAAEPAEEIKISTSSDFEYSDNTKKSYRAAEIVNASQTGTYTAPASAGTRTLHKTITTPMTSKGEADRFAENLLRLENKTQRTGVLTRNIMRQIAAGSVVKLKTTGATSWDGPAFVYRAITDFGAHKTKLYFREPLDY